MRYVLCNNASMELLDREDHVPVLAPDYVAVFDGELFEVVLRRRGLSSLINLG